MLTDSHSSNFIAGEPFAECRLRRGSKEEDISRRRNVFVLRNNLMGDDNNDNRIQLFRVCGSSSLELEYASKPLSYERH